MAKSTEDVAWPEYVRPGGQVMWPRLQSGLGISWLVDVRAPSPASSRGAPCFPPPMCGRLGPASAPFTGTNPPSRFLHALYGAAPFRVKQTTPRSIDWAPTRPSSPWKWCPILAQRPPCALVAARKPYHTGHIRGDRTAMRKAVGQVFPSVCQTASCHLQSVLDVRSPRLVQLKDKFKINEQFGDLRKGFSPVRRNPRPWTLGWSSGIPNCHRVALRFRFRRHWHLLCRSTPVTA